MSLFVSGCTHHCKGCFNADAWSFAYGKPFTREVEDELLDALAPSYISGLTLLGGEPMEPDNQRGLIGFLRRFRERFGGIKTLWIYTGCVLELDLKPTSGDALGVEVNSPHKRWRTDVTDEILLMTDVLVDGPFIESLKDISLRFRGSSNQRIIDLRSGRILYGPGADAGCGAAPEACGSSLKVAGDGCLPRQDRPLEGGE